MNTIFQLALTPEQTKRLQNARLSPEQKVMLADIRAIAQSIKVVCERDLERLQDVKVSLAEAREEATEALRLAGVAA